MKWNLNKARESLKTKRDLLKYIFLYIFVISIVSFTVTSKEGLTISLFIRNLFPSALGGILGIIILFFLLKDNRFTKK